MAKLRESVTSINYLFCFKCDVHCYPGTHCSVCGGKQTRCKIIIREQAKIVKE